MMQPRGMRAITLSLSGIIMLLAAVPAPVCAQTPTVELQVNAFPGASNLPILIAQREGMYARLGIKVTLTHPKGSIDQFKGLQQGRYPVIITAFDNVVAYHSGPSPTEISAISDLVAVMGIDSGLLALVAAPGIEQIPELKRRTVAVDALSTGFSFALRDILRRAGVDDSEVSFIEAGNSDGRWKAMREGRAQATLLTLPADIEASHHGSLTLTTMAASFGHYLGNVAAVRQSWAAGHRARLQAFLRGTSDGVAWLVAREHKARAIEILHAEMPSLNTDGLNRVYETLVDPTQGLIRSGALDPDGAQTVLALRAKYSGTAQRLQEFAAYWDTRYLESAPK